MICGKNTQLKPLKYKQKSTMLDFGSKSILSAGIPIGLDKVVKYKQTNKTKHKKLEHGEAVLLVWSAVYDAIYEYARNMFL